jgi:oligopeptide/dipeptide ABC transporter ATP-binding protein
MYEPDGGHIYYHHGDDRTEIGSLRKEPLRQYRQKARYVFQDPARSLNPRMSVYDVLVSGFRWGGTPDGKLDKKRLRDYAAAALEEVGLNAADLEKRPSEFSGGQRQRISIARSLLPQPELLICDEVVSALDVSIQCQILNLLLDIREKRINDKRTMSFLFITHDLKVACYFCDRIGVMYSGELVEEAPASSLWREGRHPYTKMLFASASIPDTPVQTSQAIPKTEAANNTTALCAFAPRCAYAQERCYSSPPPLVQITADHKARCHCIK